MEDEKKDVESGASDTTSTSASVSETSADTKIEVTKKKNKKSKPLNKKLIAALILIVILAIGYSAYKKNTDKFYTSLNSIGIKVQNPNPTMTKTEAENFINTNFMQGGTGATVTEVTTENGLFKIKLTVAGQEYTAYLTKDKKTFFPQAIDVADLQKQKAAADAQANTDSQQSQTDQSASVASMTKNDKPVVQLFVMSHCPYGTQMEKGIIPALKTLGNKVDFKLEFCDYSMHSDQGELQEEMNQYCISQNQPDKLIPYLECFLADKTGSAKCVAQVGIDSGKLSTCVASTDTKYKITANAKDSSTFKNGDPVFPIFQADVDKYKIEGSPSLVVNGTLLPSPARDSESLLKTICGAFTNAPAECSQTLDSTAPAPGFGNAAAASGTNSNASCGS